MVDSDDVTDREVDEAIERARALIRSMPTDEGMDKLIAAVHRDHSSGGLAVGRLPSIRHRGLDADRLPGGRCDPKRKRPHDVRLWAEWRARGPSTHPRSAPRHQPRSSEGDDHER